MNTIFRFFVLSIITFISVTCNNRDHENEVIQVVSKYYSGYITKNYDIIYSVSEYHKRHPNLEYFPIKGFKILSNKTSTMFNNKTLYGKSDVMVREYINNFDSVDVYLDVRLIENEWKIVMVEPMINEGDTTRE